MSSNIEKFLDAFLNWNGERLIVALGKQVCVEKDTSLVPIIKKELNEREFQLLKSEFSKIFGDNRSIEFRGREIFVSSNESELIFSVADDSQITGAFARGDVEKSMSSPEPVAEEEPVVQGSAEFNLQSLLKLMVDKGCSDLHLCTGCYPYMRLDGDMITFEEYGKIEEKVLWEQLEEITPGINVDEFRKDNDTDYAYSRKGLARFRANLFKDNRGVGAVFRQIPEKILTVDQLGVPEAVVNLCSIPKGLILVTGPTGSGKSTTLAALIDNINRTQKKHIITIEDPVEFVHENQLSLVNQREISTHTHSFKRALRAALREDPDVILVGEMRDLETIAIAIEMAVTGHLVFGTLHTSTAMGTVDRIIDQFPADEQPQIRTMLADSLKGVVSQTLLKKKKGGRVGAYEVLISSPAIANLIREGKTFQIATLMQTGKAQGMQMINSVLADLVASGEVDADEAVMKAVDKDNLKMQLKGKGLMD